MEKEAPTALTDSQIVAEHGRYLTRRMKECLDAAERPSGYVIAPGKSLSTPRGIVDEGQNITLVDFDNREAFEQRLAEGYIVKVGEA